MKKMRTINKGKMKNLVKVNSVNIDKKHEKINSRRGSELVETVLITAISLVIIVTVFYPQINAMFSVAMNNLGTWFNNAITQIGTIY